MSRPLTTFDIEMQKPSFRRKHEKIYRKFILSELVIALMTNNHKSVRTLAKECGVSAAVINRIRTGKQDDLKLTNFMSITEACGYHLVLEKGKEKIPLSVRRVVIRKPKAVQQVQRDRKAG